MFDLLSVESPYDYALAWFSEQYTYMIVGREHEIFFTASHILLRMLHLMSVLSSVRQLTCDKAG